MCLLYIRVCENDFSCGTHICIIFYSLTGMFDFFYLLAVLAGVPVHFLWVNVNLSLFLYIHIFTLLLVAQNLGILSHDTQYFLT